MPEMEKFNEQQYVWDEANSKPVRVQGTSDGAAHVQSVDSSGAVVNPASEESILLLRRIVKLLESNAVVDIANRQKVAIDVSTTGFMPYPGLGGALVANTPTAGAPNGAQTAYPLTVWETPVDQRWRVMEESHVSYQLGIRNHLAFN